MRYLTLAFYVVIGALLAWFAALNRQLINLRLWGGFELVIRLPVLLLFMFLLGALPLALLRSFGKWRMGRRVRKLEKALADTRPAVPEGIISPTAVP